VDRIEKRGEADRKVEEDARQAEIRKLRESIDPRAFELNILMWQSSRSTCRCCVQSAGLETFGDLMLQVKHGSRDAILAINGFGPKSQEEILELFRTFNSRSSNPSWLKKRQLK
jgi:hypothetical protein